jgi:hypothetical protein
MIVGLATSKNWVGGGKKRINLAHPPKKRKCLGKYNNFVNNSNNISYK